jgi:hypothetical protein
MVHEDEFERANGRSAARQKSIPRVVSASFDRDRGKVVIDLSSGLTIAFFPKDAQGLEKATAKDLGDIEITPSGFGLHFPRIDVDLYIPALLNGFFGSKKWAAARLGASGGRAKTEAKAEAARINGLLGGRPRKAHRELA